MKKQYQKIWKLALPYLRAGIRKDFVLHTEGVVKAMEIIIKSGQGDEELLIPAAILHDTGWSLVPKFLQKSKDKKDNLKALELHIEFAPEIISKVLGQAGYENKKIKKIINIVVAHKFKNPRETNKRILIDADTMADAFKKQFESDMKSYSQTREKLHYYRNKNKFYTKIAEKIFHQELEKRIK